MNYGSLIYNKKDAFVDLLFRFSDLLISVVFLDSFPVFLLGGNIMGFSIEQLGFFEMYFRVVGVFCIINWFFKCVYRIRCIFLYIWRYFKDIFEHVLKNVPEVWTIFVRTIFVCIVFLCFGGLGVLNGPPHPHPWHQCQSSLPGGSKYVNTCFFNDFLWLL